MDVFNGKITTDDIKENFPALRSVGIDSMSKGNLLLKLRDAMEAAKNASQGLSSKSNSANATWQPPVVPNQPRSDQRSNISSVPSQPQAPPVDNRQMMIDYGTLSNYFSILYAVADYQRKYFEAREKVRQGKGGI